MWYLNETNTETVEITEVKVGDIITMDSRADHGRKVHEIYSDSRNPGRIRVKGSGWSWSAENNWRVLRLLMNTDGTVKRAEHYGYRSWSPEERAEYDAMYDR